MSKYFTLHLLEIEQLQGKIETQKRSVQHNEFKFIVEAHFIFHLYAQTFWWPTDLHETVAK